jgi:hypothetical protein
LLEGPIARVGLASVEVGECFDQVCLVERRPALAGFAVDQAPIEAVLARPAIGERASVLAPAWGFYLGSWRFPVPGVVLLLPVGDQRAFGEGGQRREQQETKQHAHSMAERRPGTQPRIGYFLALAFDAFGLSPLR